LYKGNSIGSEVLETIDDNTHQAPERKKQQREEKKKIEDEKK